MRVRSYAKINLTLDILGRRPDGYHEIDTVFQQVDLFDEIELEPDPDGAITFSSTDSSLPMSDNLCVRAARIMRERARLEYGVRMRLMKQIPVGAGLSGGSSNAAAVIRGMVHLFGLCMSRSEMEEIGSSIGMDVCFHLRGGTCRGRGRGEILEDLPPFPTHYAVIVYPGFSVSTAAAYAGLDYEQIGKARRTPAFIETYDLSLCHNDFESSVCAAHPVLYEIKHMLGKTSFLSGSGSCMVGLYRTREEAEEARRKTAAHFGTVFLTKTMRRSVLTAREMGFCPGVRRAVQGISDLEGKNHIYVLGSLVHNPRVRERVARAGIREVARPEDVPQGTAVIASHGAPEPAVRALAIRGIEIVDLTCPVVGRLRRIAQEKEREGRTVLRLGDPAHSAVRGVAESLVAARVIGDASDVTDEEAAQPLALVCQTTMDSERFNRVSDDLRRRCADIEVIDTICSATKKRLESGTDLAAQSEIVIVVGGRTSANTRRLYERCAAMRDAYHIEDGREIDPAWFFGKEIVGVTAGASTPPEDIERVLEALRLVM